MGLSNAPQTADPSTPLPTRATCLLLMIVACVVASLACSSVDDVIGQRPAGPTPTVQQFVTVTPGGRVSVSLVDPVNGDRGATPASIGTPVGQIVAPAATATAAAATLQAATAIAASAQNIAQFQPSDCPRPGGPPPPTKPTSFNQYLETIGRYLSGGGPATILEQLLRSWGAINEFGQVQADTDLTGDGIPEVLVDFYDPTYYQAGRLSPGQLLIFGCSQGGYRLLFQTNYSIETMLPEIRRVGDINGDVLAEVVYAQRICTSAQIYSGNCRYLLNLLRWNASLGIFSPLTENPIEATGGRIAVLDPDQDGNWEIIVQYLPTTDPAAGPPRQTTMIYDWNGSTYVLAQTQVSKAIYRIHVVHDADYLFTQSDWRNAQRTYLRVRDEAELLPWTNPNETAVLRAYALYRIILIQVSTSRRREAADSLATLQAENPPGTAGEVYAALGQVFLDDYNKGRNRKRACEVTIQLAAARIESLALLNSYGTANPTYTVNDLCPFQER